jgi:RNA polymerase sigma-70 factor (ECF subfamily)
MEDKNKKLAEESELVKRAKKDEAAFTILYNHYFPKIYGYLFKRTGVKEITEDLVSETFLKIFTKLGEYEDRGFSFGAWVYRIATNKLVDYYRRTGRNKEMAVSAAENFENPDFSPLKEAERIQEKRKINAVLKKLPPRYQEIINLKYFAELETVEIARALKISPGNAGVLIHRALKSFAKEYKKIFK